MPGRKKSAKRVAFDRKVGANIAEAMRAAGVTQAQMAELLGVAQGNVSRMVRGEQTVAVDQLDAIARRCGVSVSMLFGEREADRVRSDGTSAWVTNEMSAVGTTLGANERRPPGLDEWLERRVNLTRDELYGLEHWRARAADTEAPGFWDDVLENVRQLAEGAGIGRGAPRGKASPKG